jgi:glycine/D-amino acid oxidase-like deaminating enzyme
MTTIIQSIRSVGIKGKRRRNQWWSPAAREAISEINAILRCCVEQVAQSFCPPVIRPKFHLEWRIEMAGMAECDVAVIGSGIAGISTAYELCKRGKSVMVIDRGRICGGMTSRTSAHLAPLCDDLVSEMTKIKGREASKLFCDSQAAAVDRIEEIQKKEEIGCDFRRLDGYLFQGRDMPSETIDQEMDALRDVGAPVHRLVGVPFNGCEDRHVLWYPRQATFHPLK